MKYTLLSKIAALAVFSGGIVSATESVNDRVAPITAAYEKKQREVRVQARAERDPEAKRELLKQLPDPAVYARQVLEIAQQDLTAEGVDKALGWVVKQRKTDEAKVAAKILLEHFPESSELHNYVAVLRSDYLGDLEEINRLIELAKDPAVVLYAKYIYADKLHIRGAKGYMYSDEEKKEYTRQAAEHFEKLLAEPNFAKLHPKLFKRSEGKFFKTSKLSVGCTIPDIVGTDHAGVEFKLSDYRGKVVFLDFWGFW